jgi:hypothetical protein
MEFKTYKPLLITGGIAALLAAVLFRRNIGAEVSLFTGLDAIPHSALGWFNLIQVNPFVGLSFLAVFDLVYYALEGLVFLALAAAIGSAHKSAAAVALAGGLVGIAVGFSSNISLTMLSLSQRYAAAASEAEKSILVTAAQSLLAAYHPGSASPATGAYISLLLIALAGLLFSLSLLRSNRAAAIVGILACACDLVYCLTFAFLPTLQIILMSFGGALWMLWHLLVAWLLIKCSNYCTSSTPGADSPRFSGL